MIDTDEVAPQNVLLFASRRALDLYCKEEGLQKAYAELAGIIGGIRIVALVLPISANSLKPISVLPEGMGTSGYKVYRYRNIYLACLHCASYPDVLGIQALQSIRQPGAMRTARENVLEMYDKSRRPSYIPDQYEGIIFTERPLIESHIEYIDLDRKIFHINGIPFFTLKCLPNDNDFLNYISEDHYFNLACVLGCPPEHQYERPAPPVVEDSEFATYQSLVCSGAHVSPSDLLAVSDVLSPAEHVRASLLETMIGQCMVKKGAVCKGEVRRVVLPTIYQFGLVSSPDQLSDHEWSTACFMANLAFIPQIYFDPPSGPMSNRLQLSRSEFTWVREDTVVCITIHLDDERCLLATISHLIDEILEQKPDNHGDYFGVAFSIFHCAIVKVVKDTHATTFSHTGALQFLPSFFADSPSTPGITALARLGYRIDPALFARAMQAYYGAKPRVSRRKKPRVYRRKKPRVKKRQADHKTSLSEVAEDAPPQTCSAVLPPELWREIAFYLRLDDLFTLGSVSKLCRDVASMVLRYPHVRDYRLSDAPKEQPTRFQNDYRFLRAASFLAVRGGIPAIVVVGLGSDENIIHIPSPFDNSSLSVRFSAHPEPTSEEDLIGDSDSNSTWGIGAVSDY